MRYTTALLAFVPAILAAPTAGSKKGLIPELSVAEWHSIQNGFTGAVADLSTWSWNKAEEVVHHSPLASSTSGDEEQLTIWQQLKADPNSFSRLVKIIEFEEKAIKYLDDKDASITFFAPNNDALKPPPGHHHHHDDDDDEEDLNQLMKSTSLASISAALDADPSLMSTTSKDGGDDDDDDKKKRRKEIFKFIAGKVLQYHGLEKPYTALELAANSTLPTALKADDGSYGGLHRRIKIEKSLLPPSLKLNFYAKVLVADKKARNGYLHTLDHPLIPGPSIFDSAYLVPDYFSTLTSAVQGLHAVDKLDWHYDHEASSPRKPKFSGNPLVTLFAPTNTAFHLLPAHLKLYLFSPFGEKALAKILMYHSLPETLLLSELVINMRHHKKEQQVENFNIGDDPSYKWEFDIETALPNATVHVEIEKKKLLPIDAAVKTSIKVNGQYALAVDVQARNGAFHPLGKILVPPHKHCDHDGFDVSSEDSWENWEDWLPAFALEA